MEAKNTSSKPAARTDRPEVAPAQKHPAALKVFAPEVQGGEVDGWNDPATLLDRAVGLLENTQRDGEAFELRRVIEKLSGEVPPLPLFESSAGLMDEEIQEAPELIRGLLRIGEFAIFAADAKMGKSWLGIELAHAVASGGVWLGHEIATTGAVAYINFELQKSTFRIRLKTVCNQRGSYPETIFQLHMRGHDASVPEIAAHIVAHCKTHGVRLIVLDSLYNTYGDRSENSNEEMGALMREIFALGRECDSAVFALHHFSKSSYMAPTDAARASGAHTLHRAPDCFVTMTKLFDKEAAILGLPLDHIHARISASLRSFKDAPAFIVSRPVGEWQFARAEKSLADLIAEGKAMKSEKSKTGPAQGITVADLCDWMGDREFTPGELKKQAAEALDVSPETVKRRREEAEVDGSITKTTGGKLKATFIRRPASVNEQLQEISARQQSEFSAMMNEARHRESFE